MTTKRPARYQPGARSLAAISLPFSSLGHTRKVLDEGGEFRRLEGLLEVRRHHVRGVTLRDLGVRVDDRRADEGLVLALERRIEVRADGSRRLGVGERVARRA